MPRYPQFRNIQLCFYKKNIFQYPIHTLFVFYKGNVPRIAEAIEKLNEKGIKATRTHFNPTAIRSEKFSK
jgi:tRNA G26 N,N-dimethylase Trm1